MNDAQRITLALKGCWHGSDRICQCPAHANTRTPALSLSDAGLGRLLAYCHASCAFMALLDTLRGLLRPGCCQFSQDQSC